MHLTKFVSVIEVGFLANGKYYHLYTRIQRLRRHTDDNNVLDKQLQFLVMPLNDRVVAMLN